MTEYVIDVYWTMYAELKIEADSPEQALQKAQAENLPEGEYVSDSLETYAQAETSDE